MNNVKITSISLLGPNLINLKDAKQYLRVTGDHDNELIISLIESSVSFAECYIKQNILKRNVTIRCVLKSAILTLPRGPLYELGHVRLLSKNLSDDALLLLPEKDYYEHNNDIIFCEEFIGKNIEIEYISGLDSVDQNIRQAIMLYLNLLYDKEAINQYSLYGVHTLLSPFKLLKL